MGESLQVACPWNVTALDVGTGLGTDVAEIVVEDALVEEDVLVVDVDFLVVVEVFGFVVVLEEDLEDAPAVTVVVLKMVFVLVVDVFAVTQTVCVAATLTVLEVVFVTGTTLTVEEEARACKSGCFCSPKIAALPLSGRKRASPILDRW